MATCNLKIELDEPKKVRFGGDTVTGTVIVNCEKDSNCKGLEISTAWSTHGRGNLDQGVGELAVAYQGFWQAGQEYRYPFKMKVAAWPPTYYGTYLNVSHSVVARAKLAWQTDPRVEKEFPVVARSSPAYLQPVRQQISGSSKLVIWMILAIIGLVFGIAFLWLLPFILLIVGLVWFFKFFLPKQLTGSVKCDVEPKRVQAGDRIKGQLSFTPKRGLKVNSVGYTISCVEKCVSGSGSNRKTHIHELLKRSESLVAESRLPAGQLQSFDVEYVLPPNAAPSMKLSDNEITWSIVFRIDIPSWPDWTETITLIVAPSEGVSGDAAQPQVEGLSQRSGEDEWFDQVLEQLQGSGDRDRLQLVLGAIREHEFTVSLTIEEELDSVGTHVLPDTDGRWLYTLDEQRDLDVALFVPYTMETPLLETVWRGRIGILDYSEEEETLSLTPRLGPFWEPRSPLLPSGPLASPTGGKHQRRRSR